VAQQLRHNKRSTADAARPQRPLSAQLHGSFTLANLTSMYSADFSVQQGEASSCQQPPPFRRRASLAQQVVAVFATGFIIAASTLASLRQSQAVQCYLALLRGRRSRLFPAPLPEALLSNQFGVRKQGEQRYNSPWLSGYRSKKRSSRPIVKNEPAKSFVNARHILSKGNGREESYYRNKNKGAAIRPNRPIL